MFDLVSRCVHRLGRIGPSRHGGRARVARTSTRPSPLERITHSRYRCRASPKSAAIPDDAAGAHAMIEGRTFEGSAYSTCAETRGSLSGALNRAVSYLHSVHGAHERNNRTLGHPWVVLALVPRWRLLSISQQANRTSYRSPGQRERSHRRTFARYLQDHWKQLVVSRTAGRDGLIGTEVLKNHPRTDTHCSRPTYACCRALLFRKLPTIRSALGAHRPLGMRAQRLVPVAIHSSRSSARRLRQAIRSGFFGYSIHSQIPRSC